MLILLSGPDDYRREAAAREVIGEFARKHSEAIRGRFDFLEEAPARAGIRPAKQVETLAQFLESQSLFASIKLAVLENVPTATPKDLVEIIREAAPRKDAVFVIGGKAIPEPVKRIAKKYEGKGKEVMAKEFDYLEGAMWRAFVKTAAEKEGAALAGDALDYFAERYRRDTWGLVTELRKVSMLGKKTLSRRDVEPLDVAPAPDFFGLLGGLKSPRLEDRLAALERMFASREPAAKMFNMLAYGDSDYVRRFAEYDVMAKSGKLEYEEILLDSVL